MEPVSFGGDDSQPEVQNGQVDSTLVGKTSGGDYTVTPVEDYSLASPFLSKIPTQDRDVVGRYIKDWDAGVTKKFQEYAGRIKPYEALGPVEELQKYVNLANNFQRDPENVFRVMYNMFQEMYPEDLDEQLTRILQIEEEAMSEDYEQEGFEEQEDPSEAFQQSVTQELEELRAWREEQEQSAQYAEESKQLDTVLQMMHNKYGQFDDNWVLQRLAEHGDVDKSIKEWNGMLGRYSQNGSQRQAPKVMGGQGGVPSSQIDTKALRGKDRRQIVAQLLESAEGA